MLASLNRIIVFVADVQKCAAFYRDMFGFAFLPTDEAPEEWQEVDAGGCRVAFHRAYGPNGPIAKPTGSPNNPHKLVFRSTDVAKGREELVCRGVEMFDLAVHDGAVSCEGLDCEGHRFQISDR